MMNNNIAIEIKKGNIPNRFRPEDLKNKPVDGVIGQFTIGNEHYKEVSINTNLNNLRIGPGANEQGHHVRNGALAKYSKYSDGTYSLINIETTENTDQNNLMETECVSNFIEFLSKVIDSERAFNHQYLINDKGPNSNWIRHNKSTHWSCNSLSNAFEQYFWGQSAFKATKTELDQMKNNLDAALKMNSPDGDAAILKASWSVLKWGGVTNHNTEWLVDKFDRGNLVSSYQNAIDKLEDYKSSKIKKLKISDWKTSGSPYRLNAGYTKIFSLICDDFIIYDSRVAAALGLLVSMYCKENELKEIPSELNFPFMEAKESDSATSPKVRNPSKVTDYTFKLMKNNSQHAEWNVRANIILSEAVKMSKNIKNWKYPVENNEFSQVEPKDQIRALEASLFMIGYNLETN